MAQLTITNGESGLDVRNALNSMFTEIYAKVDNIAAADGRTFHVNETYGAVAHYTQGFALVGLDATDAIQEAIDDCVAAGGGTVVFNPGFYRISGALRTDRSGRAQIALPVRSAPTDLLQVAVRLYCHEPAGSCAYVDGITAASGAVLCSTLTGQTIGGGGEVPSVIGGPATTASSTVPSDFTNIFVIVDGIAIVNRSNPTLTGFDFGKVCRCYLKDFRVETPDGFGGTPNCTSKHAVGVILPQDNNNVLNQLESGQVKGYYAGIIPGEHCHINGTVGFYENNIAVGVINGFTHNLNLGPYMAIQSNNYVIAGLNFSSGIVDVPGDVILDAWLDIEDATNWFAPVSHIKDASNHVAGRIRYNRVVGGSGPVTSALTVTGCARAKLEDVALSTGKIINAQTGTSYTLVGADASYLLSLSNASSITLTVPTNASVPYPVGARIDVYQKGAGQVTVAAAGGVTINSLAGNMKVAGQYGYAWLIKEATNTWKLFGDLTA